MHPYLTPAILAVAGGGTAYLVSGGNLAPTLGAAIGGLIGGWLIEKRKAAEKEEE